ncbi:MAG: hypothetical protein AAGE52_23685 [Myxococcota bacterium]
MRGSVTLCVLAALACTEARSGEGAECARNSQCAAPLVCALERCRNECNDGRDCPVGSSCVRTEDGFGVCLLSDELGCVADNECAGALVCRFERCTNECDDGCVPGTECREGACFDPASDQRCSRDGDCDEGACIGGRCRPECRSDRDCRFGTICADGRCVEGAPDAGVDAPAIDAGDVDDPFCPPRSVDVVDVCIGTTHACAALADGRAVCWGTNGAGNLGSPEVPLVDVYVASLVEGVSNARRVECAPGGGCVVGEDGTARCWGFNSMGQTGTGVTGSSVPAPLALPGLDDVVDLDLRALGGCAINTEQVYCWGTNDDGELGAPGPATRAPVLATGLPAARSVTVEENGALAFGFVVTTAGTLAHFGADPFGGSVDFDSAGSDLVEVSAGPQHVCVRRASGEVLCAGENGRGQLGDPAATGDVFAVVPGVSAAQSLRARGNTTCVTTSGDAYCWGENTGGGLGVGSRTNQPSPAPVRFGAVVPDVVEARSEFGCGVFAGAAYCTGLFDGERGRRGLPPMSDDTTLPTQPVSCLP